MGALGHGENTTLSMPDGCLVELKQLDRLVNVPATPTDGNTKDEPHLQARGGEGGHVDTASSRDGMVSGGPQGRARLFSFTWCGRLRPMHAGCCSATVQLPAQRHPATERSCNRCRILSAIVIHVRAPTSR